MMECLLLPLLPSVASEFPASTSLVQAVLKHSTNKLRGSLNTFLNNLMAHALAGKEKDEDGLIAQAAPSSSSNMELLSDQLYPLIYELHKISAGLLTDVIPTISCQLLVEDEDMRTKAVRVLGTLYASTHANYAMDLSPRYFRDFLNRFIDLSKSIRLLMVEQSVKIMKSKAEYTDLQLMIEG